MIHKEAWYKEAFESQWREFERAHDRGTLDIPGYVEWSRLAMRLGRFDEKFYEMLPQAAQDQIWRLDPSMSNEAIRDVWLQALQFGRVPANLTLEMVEKSSEAGIQIVLYMTFYSTVAVEDGGSLQYDGVTNADLTYYNHSAPLFTALSGYPKAILRHIKGDGFTFEDGALQKERYHDPGEFPRPSVIAEWARDERLFEKVEAQPERLLVQPWGATSQTIPTGLFSRYYEQWVQEIF